MKELSILLCHPSRSGAAQMEGATRAALAKADITLASNLTEAYHTVEHQTPDCLILAADLAESPDFELLGYLLGQLGVGCVIWDAPQHLLARLKRFKCHFFDPRNPASAFGDVIQLATKARPAKNSATLPAQNVKPHDPRQVLMIGASTGGVDALAKVLSYFNAFSPPTLIVQHTGGRFVNSLIRLLDNVTEATVQAAVDGCPLKSGNVYFSPSDACHLSLSHGGGRTITLLATDPVSGHRPSVDVLFQSGVAHRHHITAALLTGMGQDGARGLKALRESGAHTIAQDQATSVVYGMPRIAVQMGAAVEQLPLGQIGPALLGMSKAKLRA